MTHTPESWDDVGTLRLEVNSISLKVQDVQEGLTAFSGINELQLKKLREEIAHNAAVMDEQGQEQRNERFKMKVCNILICAILGCVLVLQVFIVCTGSSNGFAERLSTAVWKTHFDAFEASEAQANKDVQRNFPSMVENGQELKQRPVTNVTAAVIAEVELVAEGHNEEDGLTDKRTEIMIQEETLQIGKEKHRTFEQAFEHKKPKVEGQIHDPDDLMAEQPQSSPDAEGPVRKQNQEKMLRNIEEEHRESGEDPFQLMSDKMLQHFSHGFFWVCFPAKNLEWSLQKYTLVFEEFARSQKWKMKAYCWLNTRKIDRQILYEERLCNDLEKITFGAEMERTTKDVPSLHREMPNRSSFDDCTDVWAESQALFEMKSPARFQQTFLPDQDIQASLVREFLNDVHYGKIRQISPGKRDLRRL